MLLYHFVEVGMVQKAFPADISFATSWSAERIMKRHGALAVRDMQPLIFSCKSWKMTCFLRVLLKPSTEHLFSNLMMYFW